MSKRKDKRRRRRESTHPRREPSLRGEALLPSQKRSIEAELLGFHPIPDGEPYYMPWNGGGKYGYQRNQRRQDRRKA